MRRINYVIPYYNNPLMLQQQIENFSTWGRLLNRFRILIIDDGSAIPAKADPEIEIYRIEEDIPWNQHGARNLGAHLCKGWTIFADIDHVLDAKNVRRVLAHKASPSCFYRFIGRAGPCYNQFLMTTDLYWKAGGYDEDYCGHYGGDGEFNRHIKMFAEDALIDAQLLHVGRETIPDASTTGLVRDTAAARAIRLKKEEAGDTYPRNPMRFTWHKVQ